MLRSLKLLEKYKVNATDGDIGHVENFLVDDVSWAVRYLVVDTGGLLDGRQVLISPISFRDVDFSGSRFRLNVRVEKVKRSPSVDLDLPVSRQHEREYFAYYGYADYWGFGGLWGPGGYPSALISAVKPAPPARPGEQAADAHLRSARDVAGYQIEGTDGPIGHVQDFVVDDETWKIRYLIVRTTSWWPGKSVLVAPEWATRISWEERRVDLDMTRDTIKRSPEWSVMYPIAREYEEQLHAHYGRIPGWASRDRSLERSTPGRESAPRV
jgi:sporulation protein YlmC with PRC-barrel domain